ncbi:hypothetical protein BDV25DRAFT_146897 [Aspergillus avenaceus]|uniref:Uncharacterized protein n=1 Tax=Aspergillus avenaceus TaxID=36643 RepID=A0A5N6U8W4_ASPAV|nr:hypothetical protein BDV25DRAFT_146897 [Aspergillus avenaceus]
MGSCLYCMIEAVTRVDIGFGSFGLFFFCYVLSCSSSSGLRRLRGGSLGVRVRFRFRYKMKMSVDSRWNTAIWSS